MDMGGDMDAEQHPSGEQLPLNERPSSQWAGFLPQMLANATGTLLAALLVYVYGVAVGLFRANERILAPLLLTLVIGILSILSRGLEDWLDWRARRTGHRLPPGIASAVLVTPFVLAAFLVGKTRELWERIGLSQWAILLVSFAILAAFDGAYSIYRRRRRAQVDH
jgi:hypothetical protein